MRPASLFPLLALLALQLPCSAAALSDTEVQWLQAAKPVIAYAKATDMPLDIVVQPQPADGQAPLAMAFVQGRCKLVLSMHGNPEAQATLDRIAPALLNATVELMTAHELGHCQRYLNHAWYSVPAGFVANLPAGLRGELQAARVDMAATRREEAYGDLVGLAWTQLHHPQHYAQLQTWLTALRAQDRVPGSHHDTLAWVRLARDGSALVQAGLFAGPAAVWASGLGLAD